VKSLSFTPAQRDLDLDDAKVAGLAATVKIGLTSSR
jgi:hypothetical protein